MNSVPGSQLWLPVGLQEEGRAKEPYWTSLKYSMSTHSFLHHSYVHLASSTMTYP